MEGPGAQALQGKFGQLDVDPPRLRLRQYGNGVAWRNLAELKGAREAVDPLAFDAVRQPRVTLLFTSPRRGEVDNARARERIVG